MIVSANFKSKQDLSAFELLGRQLKELDSKSIEYGYFDKPHYSGLNYATLASIHEYGWGGKPMRNFITSTAILFQSDLKRMYKKMYYEIATGGNIDKALEKIAIKATKKIEFVIDQGLFSNPTVVQRTVDYRNSVGTNNPTNKALFHYGDLKKGAEWKIK